MINRIKDLTLFVIFVFLACFFLAGSAFANCQGHTREFTLYYTGNTLGYLDPCTT